MSDRRYCQYSRIATLAFVLITVYTVPVKLLQGRLADDWLHSVLHLGSALLGAYAGWGARDGVAARAFTWGLGLGYGALGIYGWFTDGLFLGTPFAIPLGAPENVFHLLLSVPALLISGWDGRRTMRRSAAAPP